MRRYRHSMRRRRRSMRRRRRSARRGLRSRGVSGDIGDCGVGITPQVCNRVTNHGDMSTFSKPALDYSTVVYNIIIICIYLISLLCNKLCSYTTEKHFIFQSIYIP